MGRGPSAEQESASGGARLERIALGVFTAVVVLSPHLIGGVLPWSVVAISAAALLSLGISIVALPPRRRVLPPAAWALLLLPLWTAMQGAFLPCGLTLAIAPAIAEQAQQAHALLSDTPISTCALSADPGNTHEELIKWCGILAAFATSLLLARAGHARAVLRGVGLSAFGLALSALGHWGADAHRVYGLYTPNHGGGGVLIAPLLNSNNLGGFLILGAGVQAGLAASAPERKERVLAWSAMFLGICVAALTLSRGALGAAVFLLAVLAVRDLRGVRSKRKSQGKWSKSLRTLFIPLLVVAGGIGLALIAGTDAVGDSLADDDFSKLDLWTRSIPVLRAHPVLGVGRGAFSAVFTSYSSGSVRFAYVENFLLQWSAEWGIPISLALLTAVVGLLGRPLLLTRSRMRYGAAAGLCAYLIQNLFDLGLELLAPALVAAVTLGSLLGRRPPVTARGGFRPAVLLIFGVISLLGYGGEVVGFSLPSLRTRLAAADKADETRTFLTLIQRGLRLHPQEAVLPYLAAGFALDHGDVRAPRFINRTLTLAPHWPGTHTLAARYLWRLQQRKQAAEEVRRAFEQDPNVADPIACEIAQRVPDLAFRMVPRAGPNRRAALNQVMRCVPKAHPVRMQLDEKLMSEFADEESAYQRRSWALLKEGKGAQAIEFLRRELARHPTKATLWGSLVNIQMVERDLKGAEATQLEAERTVGAQRDILAQRARLEAEYGHGDAARKAWAHHRALSGSTPASIALAYELLGQVEERLNEPRRAIDAYMEAHRMGGRLDPLKRAAVLAEQADDKDRARRWWRRACSLSPGDGDACAALKRLQQAER